MKSIYIDDLQIHSNTQNLGYVVHSLSGLEFPGVRLSSYDKPGEFGAVVSNQLYGGREITIEGTVFGSTLVQYETNRRQFEKALGIAKDVNSFPVAKTLKFQTMDDLQLQVSVYVKKFKMEVNRMGGMNYFLDLYAPDYYLSSQSLNSQTVGIPTGGGAVYAVIYPVTYAAATGGQVTINNQGTVEVYPTIYLNATLSNPIVLNTTNGRYMELNLSLTGTDQIVIDMANKTIVKNGSQSVIANKSYGSKFWWLEKGANVIKLITTSGGDTGNAQIQWRDAYVGI